REQPEFLVHEPREPLARDLGARIRSWQRAERGALAARAASARVAANDSSALVLLDDVELLFDEVVDDIQGRSAAGRARIRSKLVLFGLEVAGERLAPGGSCLLLRRPVHGGLLRRLRPLLEGAAGVSIDR